MATKERKNKWVNKIYNSTIGADETIPDDAKFQTSISMPKRTYVQIETIRKLTNRNYRSRNDIISTAVQLYLNEILSKGEQNE